MVCCYFTTLQVEELELELELAEACMEGRGVELMFVFPKCEQRCLLYTPQRGLSYLLERKDEVLS